MIFWVISRAISSFLFAGKVFVPLAGLPEVVATHPVGLPARQFGLLVDRGLLIVEKLTPIKELASKLSQVSKEAPLKQVYLSTAHL